MKKLFLSLLAIASCIAVFSQDAVHIDDSNGNGYAGKKIAVITVGHQFDYDANKRILQRAGSQGDAMAISSAEMISKMLKMYGGQVLNPYDQEVISLQQVANMMDGDSDYSSLQEKATSLGVDYVFMEDMLWMLYAEQLFIYEYQLKVLDVALNTIDRSSVNYYINAYRDRDIEAATNRLTDGHADQIKEVVSRITPPLYAVTGLSKNGKTADAYTVTRAGYYQNDIFHAYKVGGEIKNLNGEEVAFLTLTPLATSTKIQVEDPKYSITFDNKLEFDPALIVSAGGLYTANIPGYDYKTVPIVVIPLEGANDTSYDNHNKEVTNYALYNAIHKNKSLSVIANAKLTSSKPHYECKLSNYFESENIVRVKLTITDKLNDAIVKESIVESHISNIDDVIAAQINDVFGAPVALGEMNKKQISFYVEKPIAYNEGDKFLLSLDDENHTPIAVYELTTWMGLKYVLTESKVLDKKVNGKMGKDPAAEYVLTRYIESPKDPKKDTSEFKKVASANRVMDLMGR